MQEKLLREVEYHKDNYFCQNEAQKLNANFITTRSNKKPQKSEKTEIHSGLINLSFGTLMTDKKLNEEQSNELAKLLKENSDVFAFEKNKIGFCSIDKFKIQLKNENIEPIAMTRRRYVEYERGIFNKIVKEWLETGIAQVCESEYSAQVCLVNKKSLDSDAKPEKRLCIDFRKLNQVTKGDIYPITDTRACLGAFRGAKYFSLIDQNNGYMQFAIDDESKHMTAFRTQDGPYQFKRLCFGLKNARVSTRDV